MGKSRIIIPRRNLSSLSFWGKKSKASKAWLLCILITFFLLLSFWCPVSRALTLHLVVVTIPQTQAPKVEQHPWAGPSPPIHSVEAFLILSGFALLHCKDIVCVLLFCLFVFKLWHLLYFGGLEPKPPNLWGMPVDFLEPSSDTGKSKPKMVVL